MKIKNVIILCIVVAAVSIIGTALICRYCFPCPEAPTIKIEDEGETKSGDKAPAPGGYNGGEIGITAAMKEGKFFTVRAENKYKWSERTYTLGAICPVAVRPYSLMLQAHALAGYNKELQKMNAFVGGTVSWLWNFKAGGLGVGVTYLHGLVIDEWYAGASVTGKIDIGKIQ
ncbi:MAG: hypothetical protein KA369_08390 [Spirochaetes bacterium]|nr:hypothetical protein [Spirochaetota bacterium]